MSEMIKRPSTRCASHGSGGFDSDDEQDLSVTITSGIYLETLPLANLTVGHIRNKFRTRFEIDSAAVALINGNTVKESTIVRTGDCLIFVKRAGEKGNGYGYEAKSFDKGRGCPGENA